MSYDLRGWRLALVPDALVNPSPEERASLPDLLEVLQRCGYGLLQLPPRGNHSLLLAVIADQVAEYAHHGYAVVAIGLRDGSSDGSSDGLHWRRLAPLLRNRRIALPPRHIVCRAADLGVETERVTQFLAGYDLSLEERRRWRVSGAVSPALVAPK